MSEDSNIFNIILFLISIGTFVYFFVNHYDKAKLLFSARQKDKLSRNGNKAAQPMANIFFKYSHDNVDAWLVWVHNQGKFVQETSYERLKTYLLDTVPSQLGALISEVIKAIVSFKHSDSFTDLREFIKHAHRNYNQYTNIDNYYSLAVDGLLKLDTEKAFEFLKEELNLLKKNPGLTQVKSSIFSAIAKMESDSSFIEFWQDLILDSDYSFKHKSEILEILSDIDIGLQNDLYSRVFERLIHSAKSDSEKKEIPDTRLEDLQLIKLLLKKNNDFLDAGFNDLWSYILKYLLEIKFYEDMLVEYVYDHVSKPEVRLESEDLEPLLDFEEPLRSKFAQALAKRFNLNEEEQALTKKRIDKSHLAFRVSMIVVENSKKTKPVSVELERNYSHFEDSMIATGDHSGPFLSKPKNPTQKVVIPVLCGDDEMAKQYTIRALAANNRLNFVYADSFELINSNKVLVFQNNISTSKPAIVYLDGLGDVFSMDLVQTQKRNVKELSRMIGVLAYLPDISFIACTSAPDATFVSSLNYKENFNLQGMFDLQHFASMSMPTKTQKKVFMDDCIKVLEPSRLNHDFDDEEIISEFNGHSLIEYINYLGAFFEKSLLLEGELSLDAYYRYVGPGFKG